MGLFLSSDEKAGRYLLSLMEGATLSHRLRIILLLSIQVYELLAL